MSFIDLMKCPCCGRALTPEMITVCPMTGGEIITCSLCGWIVEIRPAEYTCTPPLPGEDEFDNWRDN